MQYFFCWFLLCPLIEGYSKFTFEENCSGIGDHVCFSAASGLVLNGGHGVRYEDNDHHNPNQDNLTDQSEDEEEDWC